ncbi:sulfotransferase family 2 domain-containing protein [Lysobacter sp. SG-8]|uniref:Sulfotransferase family 2 domain-containing protein n=1 Tax=Marilutibacter penaei TaxID=2759900 RepID=A0A7W3U2Z7_9GAMM|nr:sulfotransferase family 2 domain-containing protein [Lysobacter penaei]MBB1087967.1 sulfotransferase family 2 domain-containing protein [Lysobacter penaei]
MPFIEHNDKRLLFIHVPKTGGTSVEAWMSQVAPLRLRTVGVPASLKCTPQHLRMSDFNQLFGKGYFHEAFCLVRNPFSRIESEYRMRLSMHKSGFFKEGPEFSAWLETSLDRARKEPWLFDNHLRPQWEFVEKNVEVHKLESGLDAALSAAAASIGLAFTGPAPRLLASGKEAGMRIEWESSDIARVCDFYKRDFDTFGYSTELPTLD